MSVTVDDRHAIEAHRGRAAAFAEVGVRDRRWRSCARSATGLRHDARLAARVIGALEGLPLAHGLAGRLAHEHHRRAPRGGRGHGDAAPAPALLRARATGAECEALATAEATRAMRLLVVGHGRMGRLVEALAPGYGFEVAGVLGRSSTRTDAARAPSAARAYGGHRLLDRRGDARHGAAPRRRSACRGGRHHGLAGARERAAGRGGAVRSGRRGRGQLLARGQRAGRAQRDGGPAAGGCRRIRRLHPRGSPRGQEGRPLRHGARPAPRRGARRLPARRRHVVDPRGLHPGHSHGRLRRSGGDARARAHGARPRHVRARGARGGALGGWDARAGSRCGTCWDSAN